MAPAPGTLPFVLAVVRLDFDPAVQLFGLSVRLETIALAGAVLAALVLAAIGAGRLQARLSGGGEDTAGTTEPAEGRPRLRRDDLILFAFGAVPGAVVGGRLGYGLIHFDYYRANPSAFVDPTQGGLALTLAVVLGAVSALAVAWLLAAPIGRWLHVASVPLLVGLGLGKLAMVLGGAGQGQYSDASWATTYVRPGPWISLNAGYPALPSQAFEGGLVLAAATLLVAVPLVLRLRVRRWWVAFRPGLAPDSEWVLLTGGRRFLVALGLWAVARFAAAFTWRDATVLGPLRAEQLVLLALLGGCLAVVLALATVRLVRAGRVALKARVAAREAAKASYETPETGEPGPA